MFPLCPYNNLSIALCSLKFSCFCLWRTLHIFLSSLSFWHIHSTSNICFAVWASFILLMWPNQLNVTYLYWSLTFVLSPHSVSILELILELIQLNLINLSWSFLHVFLHTDAYYTELLFLFWHIQLSFLFNKVGRNKLICNHFHFFLQT